MKRIWKTLLIVLGSLVAFFVFVGLAAVFFGVDDKETDSNNEEVNPMKDFENSIRDKNKNSTIEFIDNNLVVTLPDESISDKELFVNSKFPRLAAEVMQLSSKIDYDMILIKTTATLLDNKGNEHQGILESALFESKNMKDINYDNWINQVTADSDIFYDLSSSFYILPSVYLEIESPTPNVAMKPLTNDFWNSNGH